MLRIISATDARALDRLSASSRGRERQVETRTAAIVSDVRRNGDRALRAYARQLDGLDGPLELSRAQIERGAAETPAAVRRAIRAAARHVRTVARHEVPKGQRIRVRPGVIVERRVTPLRRVGCYVPAGRHPLPSSLLMAAIPAKVAGVPEIVAVCPRPVPAVLAAAIEAGVDRVFAVGGAHAVAALAYGTESLPRVDKIVGPGNAWVAAAKTIVSRDCAIDFYAGPSEIVIVSSTLPAGWIAADLIAQAEHDPDARAIFVTWRASLAKAVHREVAARMPRSGPARESLAANGAIVLARNVGQATTIADRLAPEHLVCDDERVVDKVRAGATFVGPWSAQAAGDYATGSNHVLPTGGAARFRGGLSAADFVRVTSIQRITRQGLAAMSGTIVTLAEVEGLTAHAASITVRLP